jgi:hypothetical protein
VLIELGVMQQLHEALLKVLEHSHDVDLAEKLAAWDRDARPTSMGPEALLEAPGALPETTAIGL